jgi:molybdopterin-guanine dinucleotide biosynthesis protein A
MIPPLFGLVLSGGFSTRMGQDKGSLIYHGIDQRSYCAELLRPFCDEVFVSLREEQRTLLPSPLKPVFDQLNIGPAGGLLAAYEKNPTSAWLILACDMPFVTSDTIQSLVQHRNPSYAATVYMLSEIEPLFAIWESRALAHLKNEVLQGKSSPLRALEALTCEKLKGDPSILRNVNDSLSIS